MGGDKYIQILLLLLIHSVVLILLLFRTTGIVFRLELLLFLFLLFISLIFMFGLFFEEGWAWILIMLFFAVNLINLVFLKTIIADNLVFFGIVLIIDIIGFFKAIGSIGDEEDYDIEPHDESKKKAPSKLEVYGKEKAARKTLRKAAPKKKAGKKSKIKAKKSKRRSKGK